LLDLLGLPAHLDLPAHLEFLTHLLLRGLPTSKTYHILYKTHLLSHPILAKNKAKKHAISHDFLLNALPFHPKFKGIVCILHHFTFLDWVPARNFPSPNTHFLPPKTHFLMTILPLLALFLKVREGCIYTIQVYFYAFWLAFSTILPCVLHHFTLCFAPKRTLFSTKTHTI